MTGPPAADLRVLHVLEAVRGGTSRHLADVVRHTPGVVHHVALPPSGRPGGPSDPAGGAPYDHGAVARMEVDGAVLHWLDMRREPWHPANALALPRLRAFALSVGARVLHGHSSVGGALARLAASSAGVPVVYTPNGVATAAPYRLVERALGPLTDLWVAVSPSEATAALDGRLARPGRIITIPNGIDPAPPAPGPDLRRLLDLDAGTRLVGTVSRLVEQKAPGVFVRTAAEVAAREPDVHFVLIGMGPLQAQLDAEVARCGLGGRWHQIRHIDEAAAVLGQLDVFVLASEFEGGPYTPLEAMRAGVPVVVSDVVGNRDAVEHGVSGLLAPAADPPALAAAVLKLMADTELRDRLAGAGRRRVADHFAVEAMGARLGEAYRTLVSGR